LLSYRVHENGTNGQPENNIPPVLAVASTEALKASLVVVYLVQQQGNDFYS